MRFQLSEATCRLLNVNPRPELHGEEKKPAADLKLSTTLPNLELAQLHPALKGLLFMKDDNQRDLVSEGDPEYATLLRFAELQAPLKWQGEIVGATLTVHHGISPRSDLVIEGCMLNEMRLEPLNGGSVVFTFRVQFRPLEKEIGKLCMLTGQDIVVSLAPPSELSDAPPVDEQVEA